MVPWGIATEDIEGGKGEGKKGPMAARMFGNGAKEYGEKYGSTREHLAKIGESQPMDSDLILIIYCRVSLEEP
jgi:hypothetical protein